MWPLSATALRRGNNVSIKSTLSKRKFVTLAFSLIQGLTTSRQTLLVPLFYQKAILATLSLFFFSPNMCLAKSILMQKESLRNGKAGFCQENRDKAQQAVTRPCNEPKIRHTSKQTAHVSLFAKSLTQLRCFSFFVKRGCAPFHDALSGQKNHSVFSVF